MLFKKNFKYPPNGFILLTLFLKKTIKDKNKSK